MKKKSVIGLTISYFLVASLAGLLVFIYDRIPLTEGCKTVNNVISKGPHGDQVEMSEEFCEGIANSARATLFLRAYDTKIKESFFVYDIDASLNPLIEWRDNSLIVSIKNEGKVYKRLNNVNNIKIIYSDKVF